MYLPSLNEIKTTKKQVLEFKGYNHNSSIGDGEFYDMENLSSSLYPLLSPRKARGTIATLIKPNGLFSKNYLAWVDGTNFIYNNVIKGTVADSPKQFVSMGAYILIFPDKAFYNTETNVFGLLENTFTQAVSGTVTGCTIDGTAADVASSLYAKITVSGIHTGFNKFDGVKITGCAVTALNKTVVIQAIGVDYIVVTGKIGANTTQASGLVVSRSVPAMDFLTESENRIFGCSSANHEIYVSKLGDPFNWNCYEGISTDSYAATIGSDGDFTGAITYLGYVLFMKEDCIHKMHGSKPSNYQIFNNSVRGVAKGCEKSLVIVNETLYYMSRNGIVAYEGNMPSSISRQFGEDIYSEAVAGYMGDKYYISMKKGTAWHLFVFDEKTGMWHREDNTQVSYFTTLNGALYYINAITKKLMMIDGTDAEVVSWYGELSDFSEKTMNKKYVSRVQFKLELEANSLFEVEIMYDDTKIWEKIASINGKVKHSYNIPVSIRRCDFYKLKLSGHGRCKLYSMVKTLTEGSDL